MKWGSKITRDVKQKLIEKQLKTHGHSALALKDIQEVVSEAKKEFPKIPTNPPEKSDAQWIIDLTGFRLQMKEWFEKWFGGGE